MHFAKGFLRYCDFAIIANIHPFEITERRTYGGILVNITKAATARNTLVFITAKFPNKNTFIVLVDRPDCNQYMKRNKSW